MFNTELFILEVKKRPCLWNVKDSSHNDRLLKLRAWEEIVTVFNNCSDPYSHKNITVDVLQRKWKHLRDYYTREKKRTSKKTLETGSTNVGRKRSSPLLEMLQFLGTNRGSDILEITIENADAEENYVSETNEEEKTLSEIQNSRPSKIPRSRVEQTNPLADDIEESPDKQLLTSLLFIQNMSPIERLKFQKQLLNSSLSQNIIDDEDKRKTLEVRKRKKISETEECEDKKETCAETSIKRDEFSIYGEYVASKLRNIKNATARHTAEFHINGILYKAEIGEFDDISKELHTSKSTSSNVSCNARREGSMSQDEEDSYDAIKTEDSD